MNTELFPFNINSLPCKLKLYTTACDRGGARVTNNLPHRPPHHPNPGAHPGINHAVRVSHSSTEGWWAECVSVCGCVSMCGCVCVCMRESLKEVLSQAARLN